jgi:hypothetical protein
MSRYHFFTHGTSVQVEYPEMVTFIRRAGFYTTVRQAERTWNWFHFAIPTPTKHDNDDMEHWDVYLRAWVNENARVDLVHVWDGLNEVEKFGNENRPKGTPPLPLTDQDIDWYGNIPDRQVQYGLVVCVHVEFLTGDPIGEVHFIGAGACFSD